MQPEGVYLPFTALFPPSTPSIMGVRSIRLTLHSLILGLAICVNAIGVALAVVISTSLTSSSNNSPWDHRRFILVKASNLAVRYGIVSAVVGLLTWVWAGILLPYNSCFKETIHLISFTLMTTVWLIIGSMIWAERSYSCVRVKGDLQFILSTWCTMISITGTLSSVISFLCLAVIVVIRYTVHKSEEPHTESVASNGENSVRKNGAKMLQPMKLATGVRAGLYFLILIFCWAVEGTTILSLYDIEHALKWGFASMGGGNTFSPAVFMSISLLYSQLTRMWVGTLAGFHREISFTDTITRGFTHCISTMVLGVVWFVLGIIVFGRTGASCPKLGIDNFTSRPCIYKIVGILSLCLSFLLNSVSLFIYLHIKRGGGKLSGSHVAQFDGGETITETKLQVPQPDCSSMRRRLVSDSSDA